MQTLVIYDDSGYIYYLAAGMPGSIREPQGGVNFMWLEVPEKKRLSGIDTSNTPHTPVYEDLPPTLEERLEAAEAALLEIALGGM